MAAIDQIQAIIRDRGAGLRQLDVDEISALITQIPLDTVHEAEPWIWEAVGQIVDDPDYTGDASVPAWANRG